jgi:hypothetical protein
VTVESSSRAAARACRSVRIGKDLAGSLIFTSL